MAVILCWAILICFSHTLLAQSGAGAPVSKEYFHIQQANTALLITLKANEAEFESRIYGPDNALLAVSGIPGLRLGPVFQFLDAPEKDRQIRVEVTLGHSTPQSDIDLRITRFDPSGPDSSLQIKAYRLLAFGMEMSNTSRRDAWALKVGSLKQAAATFEYLGMQEFQLWSEFYAGHFLLIVLGDPISATESARAIQKSAALSGLNNLRLAALQLEGEAEVAQAKAKAAAGDSSGSERQYAQAQTVFNRAGELAAFLGMSYQQALAVYSSGLAYEDLAQNNEAFTRFNTALDIARSSGDTDLANQIRKHSADLMESMGNNAEALALMEEISASTPTPETDVRQSSDAADGDEVEPAGNARADREMAHYLFEQGRLLEKTYRHQEAVEVLQQALILNRRAPSVALTGPVGLLLAKALYESGQMDAALQYLVDAIDRTPASRYRSRLEEAFGILANIQRYRGDYSAMGEARDRQDQFIKEPAARAQFTLQRALDALAQEGPGSSSARTLLRESIAAANTSGATVIGQLATLQLCSLGASLSGSGGACIESLAQQAVRALETSGTAQARLEGRWLWSQFLARNSQSSRSRAELDQLIVEMQFFDSRLPGVMGAWYWQTRELIYGQYMAMSLPGRGSGSGAMGNETLARDSLATLTRLSGIGQGLAASRARETAAEQDQDLNNLRSLFAARAEAGSGAEADRLGTEINRQLEQAMAGFDGGKKGTASLSQLLGRLSADEVFLTYYISDDSAFAWVGGRSGVQLYRLPWSNNQSAGLSRLAEGLRWDASKGSVNDLAGMMDALGRSLLAPFSELLKPTIYFLPTGRMEGFPLDALRWRGRYIAEQHRVINLQSLEGLGADDTAISATARQTLFLAGNQLAGAGSFDVFKPPPEELRRIANLFVGPGLNMIQGSALQWDEFQDPRFSNAGLVHLAMPGVIDLRSPSQSRLLLSDNIAEFEHISLNPQDIAGKTLAAELVVLSNSNFTGSSATAFDLNTRFAGEFLQAGADSVIISLWSVGDAQASRFFTAFYQALLSGSTVADALYQTKRSFIEDSGNAGVWAAFQLFSN